MENSQSEFPTALGNPAEGAGFPHSHRVDGGIYFSLPETLSGSASSKFFDGCRSLRSRSIRQRRFAPMVTAIASEWVTAINSESVTAFIVIRTRVWPEKKNKGPNREKKMKNNLAVERLKRCENIVALSEELGVHRRLLYKWRDQLDPVEIGDEPPPGNPRESTLRKEVSQLKRLLAEKTLEVDFFRGALQKVEARRQKTAISGEKASTTKSGA